MHYKIVELDTAGLRGFAFKVGGLIAVLFGLLLPWLFGLDYRLWPWIAGGGLVLWGLLAPATLGPVYRGWMRVGLAVGWFNSRMILGIMYYLIITPTGWLMRMFGKDTMSRRLDGNVPSYRVESKVAAPSKMEKPY